MDPVEVHKHMNKDIDSGDNVTNKDISCPFPSVSVATTTAEKASIAPTKNKLVDNKLAVTGLEMDQDPLASCGDPSSENRKLQMESTLTTAPGIVSQVEVTLSTAPE